MIALVSSVLVASLLGSPHCAAMCGGFVCFYAGQSGERPLRAHAAYHLGRLISYALLGALVGLAGRGLDVAGHAAGLHRTAAVAAGAMLVVWGGMQLARALGARLPHGAPPAFVRGRFADAMRAVHAQPPAVRAGTLGLATGLLPCGWLWAFLATAAGAGSAQAGVLVMAAFWLGTLPVLAGVGYTAQRAFGPLQRALPVVAASVMLVLGLLTLAGKFHAGPLAMGVATGVECEHERP